MKIKRILSAVLAAAMMLSLAACSESDSSDSDKSSKNDSSVADSNSKADTDTDADTSSDESSKPDSGEKVKYDLPAGAASEQELYESFIDYLNGGFHADDLSDIFDLNLCLDFFSKWEYDAEDIYTLGMDYNESCDLIARLRARVAEMDLPRDEYNEIDEDAVDYDILQNEFPEDMVEQFVKDHGSFEEFGEDFIEYFIYEDEFISEGENPYGTDQTEWKKLSWDMIERYEFDNYDDFDEDLYNNFPRIYCMDIGNYIEGNSIYEMYIYYTEIDGRYYMLSCPVALGNTGG